MAGFNLFTPRTQGTVTITSAVTTASVSLGLGATANLRGQTAVRVKNIDATNVAYVNFGDSTVTATLPSGGTGGSVPIGPNETAGFTIGPGVTHAASICSAGTPIVFFTPGEGV